MAAPLLIVLFILVPLAELAVIIEVGQAIGVLPTVAMLLLASIVGASLMRAQGRSAWRRFNEAVRAGRVPHREALDGALVIFGGALLLTPGFLTDLGGLLLLLPPTRAVARRSIAGLVGRRLFLGVLHRRGDRAAGWSATAPGGPRARRGYDVEGTATEAGSPGGDAAARLDR